MSVLEEILAAKHDEVTILHRPETRELLRAHALTASPTRDFAGALRRQDGRLAVIGEIKRRSPSRGPLAPDLDPGDVATSYAKGGASALSVVTDVAFFDGRIQDLHRARDACDLPVLRKDFTIDEVQVYETRAVGADAMLLILAALPDDALVRDLHELGVALGLSVVVEVHTDGELERALDLRFGVIGVNARDLTTFDEDLDAAVRLARRIPAEVVAVAESAVRRPEHAACLAAAGFDAVLVGEALVRAPDPVGLTRALGEPRVAPRAVA